MDLAPASIPKRSCQYANVLWKFLKPSCRAKVLWDNRGFAPSPPSKTNNNHPPLFQCYIRQNRQPDSILKWFSDNIKFQQKQVKRGRMEGPTMQLRWQREFTQKEATRRWTSGYRSLSNIPCQYQEISISSHPEIHPIQSHPIQSVHLKHYSATSIHRWFF